MKRKILPIIALFCSLAITACGQANNGGEQSQEAVVSSKHTHKWVADDSKTNVEATCSAEGVKYEKCSVCGETRETKVAKKDHTFGEWTAVDGGVCGEAGQEKRECTACHATETRNVGVIPHNWVVESSVEAGNGGVAYDFVKCSKCQKQGLMVAAAKATLPETNTGEPKTAPEGCVKLGKDNDVMYLSIYLEAAKTGTLYQRGSMDYWYQDSNNNQNKTYYSENNNHTSESEGIGNFKIEVGADEDHLENIGLPENKALKYGDMLPETGGSTIGSTNWSPIGDCIVAPVSLAAGLNMIKFTRIESYNLAIHDFLVVFDAAA